MFLDAPSRSGSGQIRGTKMAAQDSPGLTPQQHRELFERYCRKRFHDGGRGCSKTVSTKKRDKVVRYLGNMLEPNAAVSPHFRFWVKSRGFQLVEMDGAKVLCLRNKQRVRDGPRKSTGRLSIRTFLYRARGINGA